jgi:hypothetical protein
VTRPSAASAPLSRPGLGGAPCAPSTSVCFTSSNRSLGERPEFF